MGEKTTYHESPSTEAVYESASLDLADEIIQQQVVSLWSRAEAIAVKRDSARICVTTADVDLAHLDEQIKLAFAEMLIATNQAPYDHAKQETIGEVLSGSHTPALLAKLREVTGRLKEGK